jgi:hypothetical protein
VADETLAAIDRVFDFLDRGADAADRVFNRGQRLADDHKSRRTPPKREVIEAEATPKKKQPTSKSTAVVHKPRFYIVEAADPKTGATIFVVTDGGNARTECSTRDFALRILAALEAA